MPSAIEVTQASMGQGPLKPGATDLDGEHALLPGLGRPATAVHHPEERRLDPGHAVPLERRHESTSRHRRLGDLGRVSLINGDRLGRVGGPDLPRGNRHFMIVPDRCAEGERISGRRRYSAGMKRAAAALRGLVVAILLIGAAMTAWAFEHSRLGLLVCASPLVHWLAVPGIRRLHNRWRPP